MNFEKLKSLSPESTAINSHNCHSYHSNLSNPTHRSEKIRRPIWGRSPCLESQMVLSVFDELAGLAVVALDVDAGREPVGIAACRHSVDGEEGVVGG